MGTCGSTHSSSISGEKSVLITKPSILARASTYIIPVEQATSLFVDQHLTAQQIQEAKKAFASHDKNGMGTIPTKSFILVMRSLGQNPTEEEDLDMICKADPKVTGIIPFVNFLDLWAEYTSGDLHIAIKEAFNLFDKDGSGTVSLEEFRQVMTKEGAQMTDEEIDEIIKNVDIDGDGEMNIEEFTAMLMRT